jgi:hypothetical protein
MTSPIPNIQDNSRQTISSDMLNFWMQLAAISNATEALFLGSAFMYDDRLMVDDDRLAGQPSFLEIQVGR